MKNILLTSILSILCCLSCKQNVTAPEQAAINYAKEFKLNIKENPICSDNSGSNGYDSDFKICLIIIEK